MSMTLYVKLLTPTEPGWFDELLRSIKGAHCSSSTSCVGPHGVMLSPDVTFSFFDDDKALAAEELVRTFPFVHSAEAKHPPARFVVGQRYVHKYSGDEHDYETVYTVTDRSRSFVTIHRQDDDESRRLKIQRDRGGAEYVRLCSGRSLLAGLWHLNAEAVAGT